MILCLLEVSLIFTVLFSGAFRQALMLYSMYSVDGFIYMNEFKKNYNV